MKQQKSSLRVLTGVGRFESHAVTRDDGTPNTHPLAGQPYNSIDWPAIVAMAEEPPTVDKTEAPWIIPSSYCGPDGRSHEAQRTHGLFWMMPMDIDAGDPSMEDVQLAILQALGGKHEALIYATRSSAPGARKWRALVPLAHPVPGSIWPDVMRRWCDALETRGLQPDRVLCRVGQIAFLPNAGDHYDAILLSGPRFDPGEWVERAEKAHQDAEAEREKIRATLASLPPSGDSVIERWCDLHPVGSMLAECGYVHAGGRSPDWRSPYQQSVSFATREYERHWISLSESDAQAGLGRAVDGQDYRFGDAFDLFVHFKHGGDQEAAMRAAVRELGVQRQARFAQRLQTLPEGPTLLAEAEEMGEAIAEEQDAEAALRAALAQLLVAYVPSISARDARWFDISQPGTLRGTVAEMWTCAGVDNVYGIAGFARDLLPTAQRTTKMPVIDPRLPYGFVPGEDGLGVINKCRLRSPEGVADGEGWAVSRFMRVLEQVIPDEVERFWFLDWLATKVQRPWERMVGVVSVARTHGTGRGGLFYILRMLFGGSPNAANVSMDRIAGGTAQWSQWLEALLVTVEEADPDEERGVARRSTSSRKAYAILKDYVDPGVKSVMINVKGGPTYETPSYSSFLIATNSEDALPIAESDRRFTILQGNDERASDAFYPLCKALAEDEAALDAIWLWLTARDVSGFRCDMALKTDARALMIEAGKTDLDVDIEGLLGSCCYPCVISAKLLQDLLVRHSEVAKAMNKEGYLKAAVDRWMRDNTAALMVEEQGYRGAMKMSVAGYGQMRVRVPSYANLKAVKRMSKVDVQQVVDAVARDIKAVSVEAMGAVRATKVRGV